jgi:hypothetical protein
MQPAQLRNHPSCQEGISMRNLWFALLLSGGLLLAQDNPTAKTGGHKSKAPKDEITVQGCVGRSSGDYILTKRSPAMTWELQASGKTRLRDYLGQRVEVTGTEGPTMSSSSDALNKTGSASSVTLTITSIKTIDKECTVRSSADQ